MVHLSFDTKWIYEIKRTCSYFPWLQKLSFYLWRAQLSYPSFKKGLLFFLLFSILHEWLWLNEGSVLKKIATWLEDFSLTSLGYFPNFLLRAISVHIRPLTSRAVCLWVVHAHGLLHSSSLKKGVSRRGRAVFVQHGIFGSLFLSCWNHCWYKGWYTLHFFHICGCLNVHVYIRVVFYCFSGTRVKLR